MKKPAFNVFDTSVRVRRKPALDAVAESEVNA
jgi:hypothetical protein